MNRFDSLAITDPAELRFGAAPKPLLTRNGLSIGGGQVADLEIPPWSWPNSA